MAAPPRGLLHSIAEGSSEHLHRPFRVFWNRAGRVVRLDPSVFDEIALDPRGWIPALSVVLIAGLARGVFDLSVSGVVGVAGSVAGALAMWLVATGLLTSVGVHWLHGTTDFREMLRTLGFAALPLWFLAPAFFLEGVARNAVAGVAHAWAIAAAVVAVRQALECGTARALAACLVAFALAAALLLLLGVPVAH